jgi:hypothetical protein
MDERNKRKEGRKEGGNEGGKEKKHMRLGHA